MSAQAGERAKSAIERARAVRLMLFDVDGVLTDGRIYLSDRGEETKAFNSRDGQGIKLLRESGIRVGLISARNSRTVDRRATELGIELVRQGASDKARTFAELLGGLKLRAAEAGYMGDDLADLPVLTRCGFAASVPSAPEAVRTRVHYVALAGGGDGAAREVCEFILAAQDALDHAVSKYLV
ncbi:MAG: phenylphosphate carboxylase subunit delta [Betaproteobacteria bacterium RIFCSPLOWO2_12_FULL_63_13]|nr:MAG: phenylphosphate carboxylase subunit delta [Betaproteobacteria bacterium RIFCSPLOWO2_02_FULL_63_19]OGA48822.1 MAG: phenylphosphate carboxylase subunit delta [Betaproteobacteria bacterium RIFCSPLOWO2_12_FULL_63_13]